MSQLLTGDSPVNQSVERAVRILGFFSVEEPELTLTDLTTRLGASKATTHRYTLALRRVGLLRFDDGVGVYSLGPRIVELAATALAGLRIIKVAGPTMEQLVANVNETVVLSIWDGESPVVVRVEDNTDRLVRIVVRTGARLPPKTSAQGKIFLAFSGQASILDDAERVSILKHRVAVNSQVVDGIRAIATPIFQGDEIAAAMAVVGTIASLPEDPTDSIARELRAAAEQLSAGLGFLSDNERSA
ncbi:MAG TPA: IclR family transcriptional regulator [Gaiellaceae bacterium]|nr:IclR family transcriptional regulator [Gaiellaceae bacterium]